MRTFIAIELPSLVQTSIRQLQQQVQQHLHHWSLTALFTWTPPEKIHLTLRFLGETNERQAALLPAKLMQLTQHSPPLQLTLAGLGCFPNPRQPRILWLGIHGELPVLLQLQTQTERLAQELGFAAEARPFSPHLTIARLRRNALPADSTRAGSAIRALITDHPLVKAAHPFTVNAVIWMRSELLPDGARYTSLGQARLGARRDSTPSAVHPADDNPLP